MERLRPLHGAPTGQCVRSKLLHRAKRCVIVFIKPLIFTLIEGFIRVYYRYNNIEKFLFLTASRYADLKCMMLRSVWKQVADNTLIIRLDLPIWKSDRYGKTVLFEDFSAPPLLHAGGRPNSGEDATRVLATASSSEANCAPTVSAQPTAGSCDSTRAFIRGTRNPSTHWAHNDAGATGGAEVHGPDSPQQGGDATASYGELPSGTDGKSIDSSPTTVGTVKEDWKLLWSTIEHISDEPQVEFAATQGSSDTAKLLFFVEGKAVVMRTKRASCHLPFGPIAPPSFDFAAMRALFQECEPDAETRYIINIFTQDTIADFITAHADFVSAVKATHTVIRERIIAEAVDELCQQQTLAQVIQGAGPGRIQLTGIPHPKARRSQQSLDHRLQTIE